MGGRPSPSGKGNLNLPTKLMRPVGLCQRLREHRQLSSTWTVEPSCKKKWTKQARQGPVRGHSKLGFTPSQGKIRENWVTCAWGRALQLILSQFAIHPVRVGGCACCRADTFAWMAVAQWK